MKKSISLIVFCLISLFAFSQEKYNAEEFKSSLMESKTGAMLVFNGNQHSFTIDLKGSDVKPAKEPNFYNVDNKILQAAIIASGKKIDFDNINEVSQKKNLLSYMDYEFNYIKEQLKANDLQTKHEFIKLNNKLFLFWYYFMPKEYKTIDKQCYLITICFDNVLVLNSPIDNGKKFKDVKDFLINIGNSLKQNKQPIDFNKLKKELNKN